MLFIMTNLEAISAACNYPVEDKKLQKLLIDQGIKDIDEYTGITKAFELATANLYVLLVTSGSIAEGNYQASMTEKANLTKLATGIFSKYGVFNPLQSTIRNRSHYW
jgi:hypothetical protein